jgi:hypothetical protein
MVRQRIFSAAASNSVSGVSLSKSSGRSRGKKKPSLRDLSRQMPSAESFAQFMNELDDMEDRAVVLILSSMVENFLEMAITSTFVEMDDKTLANLFSNPNAPLSSFSAKIAVGHALGVYATGFRRHLDGLRIIRNAFAQAMLPISFNEPLIIDECKKLDPQVLTNLAYQQESDAPKERFISVGRTLAVHLMNYTHRSRQVNGTFGRRQPSPDKFVPRRPPKTDSQN